MYRLIAEAAAQEVRTAKSILDIGNGGIFIFPIDHIPLVEAIDLFVDESFSARYPEVHWRKMSVLDLEDRDRFDTIVMTNCLHHVTGRNVAQCYQNLRRILEVTLRALKPAGKLVVIEGTDGSGRSTQIAKLSSWLESNGFAVRLMQRREVTAVWGCSYL